MFGSVILDTAIGLAFLYLLLSLLVTGINELIETWLKNRAKDLELGMKELLGNHEKLLTDIYNHPMLFGLFRGERGKADFQPPSYIPSRSFALALMDLICPATAAAGGAGPTPGWPSGADGATAVRPAGTPLPTTPPEGLKALRKVLEGCLNTDNGVVPPKLARGLLALVDAAGNDAVRVRKNIEDWFDGTMDRVSGWYKRRMQWVTAVVGLVLAIGLNADTFAVADSLARDPALRASVATAAEEYAKTRQPPDGARGKEAEKKEPEKKEAGPKASDAKAPDAKAAEAPPTPQQIAEKINEVKGFGWPVGWDPKDSRTMPDARCGAWALKFFGWVVTAFAIMLGAPFWFDTLNKIMVIRSTVKPKEKSPDEPPVDRR